MAAITTGDFVTGNNGQYLRRQSLAGSPNLQSGSYTIGVRVKHATASTSIGSVIAAFDNNAQSQGLVLGRNSGVGTGSQVRNYRIGTSTHSQNIGTAYGNTTTWYHLTTVYNASTGFFRGYIDGVFIAQFASATGNLASSTNNTALFGWHPGKYADAFVFDRALSDAEVTSMSDYRVPQVTSGLLGFWRLDSNGNDTSGNAQTLSAAGSGTAVSYSTADNPPQPEGPAVALLGGAASSTAFAGTLNTLKPVVGALASSSAFAASPSIAKPIAGAAAGSSALAGQLRAHVSGAAASSSALAGTLGVQGAAAGALASSSAFAAWLRPRWGRRITDNGTTNFSRFGMTVPTNAWTVMLWVRSITLPNGQQFRVYVSGTNNQISFGLQGSGGTPNFIFTAFNGTATNVYSAAADGAWHHMAASYDGTDLRSYVDGALVATTTYTWGGPTFTQLLLTVTTDGLGNEIAEVAQMKMWFSTLSGAEIAVERTYTTPTSGPGTLYAWWQLGWQGPGVDSSPAGRNLNDNDSTEAQSEAPGIPLTLFAASASSTSAFAGSMLIAKPIAGDLATSSVFKGSITVTIPIAGAAASASTLTASLTALLTGAASSTSSFAASLGTFKPIAGDAATSSAFAAALNALISSSASSTSDFAGALVQAYGVAGASASSSAFSGLLGIQGLYASALQSTSAFDGTLGVLRPHAGAAASSSSLAGTLVQDYAIAGGAASTSAFAGSLGIDYAIQGSLTTTSAFGGTLTLPFLLQGSAASVSALAGTLGVVITADGALSTTSAFQAQLTAQLATGAGSFSSFGATLQALRAMSGAAASSSLLTGNLTVLAQRALVGAAASSSAFTGALSTQDTATAVGNVVTDGIANAFYGPGPVPSDKPGPRISKRWPPRY